MVTTTGIPTGYVPTIAAAKAYTNAYPDLVNAATVVGWVFPKDPWTHFLYYGNAEGRIWNFNLTDSVPATTTAAANSSFPTTIFGVDSKVVLIGGAIALFFLMKE